MYVPAKSPPDDRFYFPGLTSCADPGLPHSSGSKSSNQTLFTYYYKKFIKAQAKIPMSGQTANWNVVLRCCSAEVLQSFGAAVLQQNPQIGVRLSY